ncbi:MAG: hypothetical protein ACRYG8_44565 [Janthinobacterium lividum]
MATMSVMAGMSATHGFRAPARSVHWLAPRAPRAAPIHSQHVVQAADAAMRFALALVPFSALAWMFIAR